MSDSVVAAAEQTAAGVTLFAQNSDRHADECQPFRQFSEANHPPGSMLRCSHIAIPQVAETYRVMGHSPWWAWGFEHGVNEHAVAIATQRVSSREAIEKQPGLIGIDLVRLGLERGRSAREALEIIAGLIEVHGQGGSTFQSDARGDHSAFLLADPTEAWRLETSNRRWAARRCELESVSNHYHIRSDWHFSSRDLADFARERGWWSRSGRLDVALAYGGDARMSPGSDARQQRARELLDQERGRHDRESFQSLLRDHLEDAAEHGDSLCAHREALEATTASLIAPLPAALRAPWPVWISFAAPCTGVFLPVYLSGAIPAELARGGEQPRDDSAWWAFKRLHDAASADYARALPRLRAGWAEFENELEQARRSAESMARGAIALGDRDRAAQDVTKFMDWAVESALQRAEVLLARLT
ncbi:MAG TPA: C69 family dipeptidase [Myxococcota bacterium]|nr:C69 family dipeptidase [Myxococcota bacterium]